MGLSVRRSTSLVGALGLIWVLVTPEMGGVAHSAGAGAPVMKRASSSSVSAPLDTLDRKARVRDGRYPDLPVEEGTAKELPTDPVVTGGQPGSSPVFSAPEVSFEALSNADNRAVFGFPVVPPDTNGDIGPNHYVQAVNLLFQVFDRAGGEVTAPFGLASLFATANPKSKCALFEDGDPIVQYDHLADRWLLSQFFLGVEYLRPPFSQCIAVSTSPDPTGSYFLYEFEMPNSLLNDYPKFGVWPDAYYMSDVQFDLSSATGSASAGQGVFAFDRARMLRGDPQASYVYFNLGTIDPTIKRILPADLDGRAPVRGTPAPFASYAADDFGDPTDALRLFDFRVDFKRPSSSSFTQAAVVPVAPFEVVCPRVFRGRCISQPQTGTKLEALRDRLMYRLQYRNFGTHESLAVAHTVGVGPATLQHAGVRAYELRRSSGGTFGVHSQATFAPDDKLDRWMPSAALDRAGNLAVGYSVSGPTTYPSIRYTGRRATDPPGAFSQVEQEIQAGGGSQTGAARWGDYTSMSIDPIDGCGFWYTNQYLPVTSGLDWTTRVARFSAPSC